MAEVVFMPKLGLTMETGTVFTWQKAEGETVRKGEILLEIETDKITGEMESPYSRTLLKILVSEGEEVSVQIALAVIGKPGEDISEMAGSDVVAGSSWQGTEEGEKQHVSPRARKLLKQHGLSLDIFRGIDKPRIAEADIQAYLESRAAGVAGENAGTEKGKLEPQTRVQHVVAERMEMSFRDIPQFSLRFEVEMDRALGFLSHFSEEAEQKITVNDLLLRAVALALSRSPEVQCQYRKEGLFTPNEVNIGVAVGLEKGLIVPVIQGADRMRIAEISAEAERLIGKSKGGHIGSEEISGGTFTVSNLGMFGVSSFNPIINPVTGQYSEWVLCANFPVSNPVK